MLAFATGRHSDLNAILACWHVVIPYLCEDLPDTQKEALSSAQKVPLLYTNVGIRNWKAFRSERDPCLLARGDPLSLRGPSRHAKGSFVVRAKSAAALYQCWHSQLEGIPI